jgi:hypothetical protein
MDAADDINCLLSADNTVATVAVDDGTAVADDAFDSAVDGVEDVDVDDGDGDAVNGARSMTGSYSITALC